MAAAPREGVGQGALLMPLGGGSLGVPGLTPFFGEPAMRPSNSDDESSQPTPLPSLPLSEQKWGLIVDRLKLSPQLANVAELLLRQLCRKQIGQRLRIKETTVRTYIERLALLLHVSGVDGIILRIFAEAEKLNE